MNKKLDLKQIRKDFVWIKNNPDYCYFDSSATNLRPNQVIKAISDYYSYQSTNVHNLDSSFAYDVYLKTVKACRDNLAEWFNCQANEIIFNSGSTEGLSMIANGLSNHLTSNDEVLLTLHEHSSNLIPWVHWSKKKHFQLKYVQSNNVILNENDIIKNVSAKTKVLAFANVTNMFGQILDLKKIVNEVRKIKKDLIIVIDAAQSALHTKINLKELDIDFLVTSAHKMCGPTGIGCVYINQRWHDQIDPLKFGGGMNHLVSLNDFTYAPCPDKFEGGTLNIAGIVGWNAAINYLKKLGLENIANHNHQLKAYAIEQLKKISNLVIYNENTKMSIILCNLKNLHAQDFANYLGYHKIIVRSGLSCAKLLPEINNENGYVRISLNFYNDFNEIDHLCEVIKKYQKGDELNYVI